jgi:predicted unusual protein kinase regulating ubiquinone biosynthesis (AarF/ABC1/UbiB family)
LPNPAQVVVPRTYSDYTSRRVLTTEWLDGEKLSQSKVCACPGMAGTGE